MTYGTPTVRTATNAVPELMWSWGGMAGGVTGAAVRYSSGLYHNVRIYNRKLTEEELAHNRMIDEVRFRGASPPATNVLVETSLGELAGVTGAYIVNGAQVFTPPASPVMDGVTYSPTGYTIAHWNALSNAWDRADFVSAGSSYAYTNCLADAKVRLVWQYSPVGGIRRYDLSGYATNGLVLHVDGIANAGAGSSHDSAAAVWKNLAGGPDLENRDIGEGYVGHWTDNAYHFAGSNWWETVDAIDPGPVVTIQTVTTISAAEQKGLIEEGWNTYPSVFGNVNDNMNLYTQNGGSTLYFKADAITGNPNSSAGRSRISWHGLYSTTILDHNATASFENLPAAYNLNHEGVFVGPVGPKTWCVGGSPQSSGMHRLDRSIIGDIHAVRFYSRKLTPDEIAFHRDIDEMRFRGVDRPVFTSNAVEVISDVPVQAAEHGFFRMYGSHTFTMPATCTAADGREYACVGYQLEDWNATTNRYVNAVTNSGTSCTLSPDVARPIRRLTWMWRRTRAAFTADSFSSADYVQRGLIAHYDGIENVGAGLPHDNAASRWVDLSYRKVPMELGGADVTRGSWTQDGYEHTGFSYWRMTAGVALGMEFTVQQVMDIDFTVQTNSYPNYFAITSDAGVFSRTTNKALSWKFDSWGSTSGTRATLAGFGGKFLTAGCDAEDMYLTQTTEWGAGTARTKFLPVGMYQLSFASAAGVSAATRYTLGIFKAARLYSRRLTAEELAWNRLVDEARFNGTLVRTNLTVLASANGAEGVEKPGDYLVEGAWSFSAKPVVKDEVVYTPRGYTLQTFADGEWGAPVYHDGTNFVYDTSVSSAPVRLAWKWKSHGLKLYFR